jgi:hypothetical protein
MKKSKKGIEISHWKVNGTDAFSAIDPAWSNEELGIEPQEVEYNDPEIESIALEQKTN